MTCLAEHQSHLSRQSGPLRLSPSPRRHNVQWDYLIALLLIGGLSLAVRPTWKIGVALIGTWCFCTAAVYVTGNYTPWQAFAFANIAATVFIMRHPANKVGSVIGGTLLVQALIDLAFGAANNPSQAMQYLDLQTQIAWLQLALMGFWHGGRCVRGALHYRHTQARDKDYSHVAGR
jgi:hypothetical protein